MNIAPSVNYCVSFHCSIINMHFAHNAGIERAVRATVVLNKGEIPVNHLKSSYYYQLKLPGVQVNPPS